MIDRSVESGGSNIKSNHDFRTAEDPTKAILSKSALDKKYLCDYVINVATGCRHGCKFCYVPSTPNIRARPKMLKNHAKVENPQLEWGNYVLYRDDLPHRLDDHLSRKRSWRETKGGCGIVGISFATDCYMDGRAGEITSDVIEVLAKHNRYSRVLTRNPILALQDLQVFKNAGDYVTIGTSIPSLDAEQVAAIEPKAPAPEHRLRGLKEFADAGVKTYVSMSPTYPTLDRDDLRKLIESLADVDPTVIFHEPINPRAGNFQMTVEAARDAGELELAHQLDQLRDREKWVEYSTEHFRIVQAMGEELSLPIHLWPDRQHIKNAKEPVAKWLKAWRERQSPEQFAGREVVDDPMPSYPQLK